jgi:hypothetical protein
MEYGLVAFLVAIVAARYLAERGFSTLDIEQKTRLVDGFTSHRKFSLVPIALFVVVYLGATRLFPDALRELTYAMFGITIIYVFGSGVWMARRLQSLEMSARYVRTFLWARALSTAGVLALFGAMLWAP